MAVSCALVGSVVAVAACSGDSRTDRDASSSKGATAVADYLAGDGSLVAKFRDLSAPLLELGHVDASERQRACEAVAADLDASVDPSDLYEVAAAMPDPDLAEIVVDERAARSALLIACGAGDTARVPDALNQVVALDKAFRARMDNL